MSQRLNSLNPAIYATPPEYAGVIAENLSIWKNLLPKFWMRDSSVWTKTDEAKWLGWLNIVDQQLVSLASHGSSRSGAPTLLKFQEEIKKEGFEHVALLGMGGSSLAPEVLEKTFQSSPGFPKLHILDSTDPDQISTLEKKLNLPKTLFIVSSKSGSTLEPNIFMEYFYDRLSQVVGAGKAGAQFIAITDPASALETEARKKGFRHTFHGEPSIGGRYSALSHFGMVPGAAIGLDVMSLLVSAKRMSQACGVEGEPKENPGVMLGVTLGGLWLKGRDKVSLIASPEVADLTSWIEQLLAESTGKNGKALIPVSEKEVRGPDGYDNDRQFYYIRLGTVSHSDLDQKVDALAKAGHPVVTMTLSHPLTLGQEFFRWEMATAVAGNIMKLNPFDQPDVEASKIETKKLTSNYEATGSLPAEEPFFTDPSFKLFADPRNTTQLKDLAGGHPDFKGYLKSHFDRVARHNYVALLAYIEMNDANIAIMEEMKNTIEKKCNVAVCVGFGPRFLHSTGQAYKGGPNSGVVLQITNDPQKDLKIPGHKFTFSVVKAAQARGDLEVLAQRERRLLRVHITTQDVSQGLTQLSNDITEVLGSRS